MKVFFKYYFLSSLILLFLFYSGEAKSTFSSDRLKQSCIDFINQKVGGEAVVSISQKILTQEFQEDGVTAMILGDEKNLRGNIHLSIEFHKDGRLIKKLEIPVRIRIYRDVAKTTTTIMKGNVIIESDISTSKEEITNINPGDLISPTEIAGIKAKRNIPKGTIITKALLETIGMVHQGDKVTIIIKSGAITVKTSGVALQDAEYGKNIRIKRDGSQSILNGLVAMDGSILISPN